MKVSIIGSGNVATHLAMALRDSGHTVASAYSQTEPNCQRLCRAVGATAVNSIADLLPSDVCIIAASDNAIAHIATQIDDRHGIVAHTSGATGIEALGNLLHCGVLYPCQTFSREAELNFREVPMLIEASDSATEQTLTALARSITDAAVAYATSHQRATMHAAAVVTSNFGNHLMTLAADFLQRNGMELSFLQPLMKQTIEKAFAIGPREAQTGPARRHDTSAMDKHRELIDDPTLLSIYNQMNDSIMNMYKK